MDRLGREQNLNSHERTFSPYCEKQLNVILEQDVYGLSAWEKQCSFLARMRTLCIWHFEHCIDYRRILIAQGYHRKEQLQQIDDLAAFPYLAIPIFKRFSLKSIRSDQVFKVLKSSGTTSQVSSVIFLDGATAGLQSKVLVRILQSTIGRKRLPMMIVDRPEYGSQKRQTNSYSARGAGIQGLSILGRDHTFVLEESLQLNLGELDIFCEKYQNRPVLIFGFTFLIWQSLLMALKNLGKKINLPEAILIHGGGWKKLQHLAVENEEFKRTVTELTGIRNIHNFYGMAEQVGSIFVECDEGYLHAPFASDVLVRHPATFESLSQYENGLLQVLSLLPMSYPGHSILTEDLGQLMGEDDCPCGKKGKYFLVEGRIPKAEIRGCSDTVRL